MRAWLQRFMSGRYGSDAFGNFLCVVSLICLVLGLFVGIFYYIGLALLIYTYFRMLSRNVSKRYAENQMFRYFSCPRCKQQIRVPKSRGRISITCPKCGTQFIKKT